MAVRERTLGKGTIGYRGEAADYYRSKTGLWRRWRPVIAAALVFVGLLFLAASTADVVSARVERVVPTVGDQGDVLLSARDGRTGSVSGELVLLPEAGTRVTAMILPGGRWVLGDRTQQGRNDGLLFVLAGVGMVLWGRRQDRRRGTGVRYTGPVDMRLGDAP